MSHIKVWVHEQGGRHLLGEYREDKYAINRANNYQEAANKVKDPVYIEVVDTQTDAIIHRTDGEFTEGCQHCPGSSGVNWRGGICETCNGTGTITVKTTAPVAH